VRAGLRNKFCIANRVNKNRVAPGRRPGIFSTGWDDTFSCLESSL
jgi:hypothetical protein